jgi:hypothetical protein
MWTRTPRCRTGVRVSRRATTTIRNRPGHGGPARRRASRHGAPRQHLVRPSGVQGHSASHDARGPAASGWVRRDAVWCSGVSAPRASGRGLVPRRFRVARVRPRSRAPAFPRRARPAAVLCPGVSASRACGRGLVATVRRRARSRGHRPSARSVSWPPSVGALGVPRPHGARTALGGPRAVELVAAPGRGAAARPVRSVLPEADQPAGAGIRSYPPGDVPAWCRPGAVARPSLGDAGGCDDRDVVDDAGARTWGRAPAAQDVRARLPRPA